MGKNNNIIEINGQRYDAKTGAALSHHSAGGSHPKPVVAKTIPVISQSTLHDDVVRQPAKSVPAHAPKQAHTLMRQSVKKPAAGPKHRIKVQSHTDETAKQALGSVIFKPSVKSLDPKRLRKASRIAKSDLISHFSATTSDTGQPSVPAPVTPPQEPTVAAPVEPAPITKPKPSAKLLERALSQAASHEPSPAKKTHHKLTSRRASLGAASALVLLLLGIGAVGYQELPNIRLHLASAKAGLSASMPGYRPAGYSLGQLNYSDGVVATRYQSPGGQAYTVIQKRSVWNNQALRDEFVASSDRHYQTVETGGRTIYLYGDHNATWINGGIWYITQSNGALSNQQLIEVATSL